jgi:hypothetical protein
MQLRDEVVDVTFPVGDETTEVMPPGKEALDPPAPMCAAQRPATLREMTKTARWAAIISMP